MGKQFEESQVKEVMEACKGFVNVWIQPFNPDKETKKEVLVQVIPDGDDEEPSIELDIYTYSLINRIWDHALSRKGEEFQKPHLFLYRFTARATEENIAISSHLREIGINDAGWIKATLYSELKDSQEGLRGSLTLWCGDVTSVPAFLADFNTITRTDSDKIHSTTEFIDRIIDNQFFEFPAPTAKGSIPKRDYSVDLYKVGSANSALITNTENCKSLLIDGGIDRYYPNKYSQAEDAIKKLNPEHILISHNHEDHLNLLYISVSTQGLVLGIKTNSLESVIMLETAIDDNQKLFSEQLLRSYFGKRLKIIPDKTNFRGRHFLKDFPVIQLHRGTCKDKSMCVVSAQSYYENDTGMIVTIDNKQMLILSGDCSYDFFPSSVRLIDADYIVVPHHGGKTKMKNRNIMVNNPNCLAIVSSRYGSFFPSTAKNYQKQLDQEIFLKQIGITQPVQFLENLNGAVYSFTV